MSRYKSPFRIFISFSYLFSDIIAGRYKDKGESIGFVISFETPSEESVKYIESVIQHWYIRKIVKTVYFTEGSNMDIQDLQSLKPRDSIFEIKILNGDLYLDISAGDV